MEGRSSVVVLTVYLHATPMRDGQARAASGILIVSVGLHVPDEGSEELSQKGLVSWHVPREMTEATNRTRKKTGSMSRCQH